MDYGALREFRRHRMMTPTFQPLTVKYGTNVPRVIGDSGLAEKFQEAAGAAAEIHGSLEREIPPAAQYAVTHAHNPEGARNGEPEGVLPPVSGSGPPRGPTSPSGAR